MTDRRAFYDERAPRRGRESRRTYHRLLRTWYSFIVPAGARVMELGCGIGELLSWLKPSRGVGVDFSGAMVREARARHSGLEFHEADAAAFETDEQFDYVILSDLVNDLPDVQGVLDHVRRFTGPQSRLVLNFHNSLWRPVLAVAAALGLKAPTLPQNWLSLSDVRNLLHLAGWEVVRTDTRILWPAWTPLIEPFLNSVIGPLLRHFCLTAFVVARPRPEPSAAREYSCTVVVPARNEAGNIEAAVTRTPEMGKGTELLFIEGHSRDNTWDEIQRVIGKYPDRKIRALKQQSAGKGGAVREAFAEASGEALFILDADLTMPPEELPRFYELLRSGQAEFVNGCRLVYPMEDEAMQFLNMIANKFFGLAFTWMLGQSLKDTLCGTKVLLRSDYERIAANRSYFGDFDPFGDFDLLFGAARLNMRMLDMPIRYRARSYGTTNISRWRHGALLFRMLFFAARRFKFRS